MTGARTLPAPDELSRPFWTAGELGVLRIQRCGECRRFQHPPLVRCRACGSGDLTWEEVSGRATVYSFTVNHQQWHPDVTGPYTVAIVELDEQPGLLLTSELVDVEPDDVRIGIAVAVEFLQVDDVWLPLFHPAPAPSP